MQNPDLSVGFTSVTGGAPHRKPGLMEKKKIVIDEKLVAAMNACVEHARALVHSARAVLTAGHPSIAYHLATLALEEIGRRALLGVQSFSEQEVVPPAWPKKHEQDHIKKLYWCFFGANFFTDVITPEALRDMSTLAQAIHQKRLLGLYVDNSEDGLSIPSEAVTTDEAEKHLAFAQARLDLAENEIVRTEIPPEDAEVVECFQRATSDPERRKQILSPKSLEKLSELRNTAEWAKWLKGIFDNAEAEGRAAVQRELERSQNLPGQKTKYKWKVRVRILCASHSIRPKELAAFNALSHWIKLTPVSGKKNELLIDFMLGDNVPVEGVWYFGWHVARRFVVALNIGSMGFFWWRMPEQISRYYEFIEDLERSEQIGIDRQPSLRIDWGENRVLTIKDLGRVTACFATFSGPEESIGRKALDYYVGGITFLSLVDVHWQGELQTFGNFFYSLKAMMEQTGDLKSGEPFEPPFAQFLDELFPNMEEKSRYLELCRAFEAGQERDVKITLKEVSFIKLFCDAYYVRKILPQAVEGIPKPESDAGPTPP